jgi:hypothetical protein
MGAIYGGDLTLPEYVKKAIANSKEGYCSELDPFLDECGALGWHINSPWDLCTPGLPVDVRLFPVLTKHVQMGYPDPKREGMLIALERKEAKPFALDTVRKILDEEAGNPKSRLRDAAASALVAFATKADIPYFESILSNEKYGDCRLFFVAPYARLAKANAVPLLRQLLDKGELLTEVINELGKLKDLQSRKAIEKHVHSANTDVRRFTRKALERLNKVH